MEWDQLPDSRMVREDFLPMGRQTRLVLFNGYQIYQYFDWNLYSRIAEAKAHLPSGTFRLQ